MALHQTREEQQFLDSQATNSLVTNGATAKAAAELDPSYSIPYWGLPRWDETRDPCQKLHKLTGASQSPQTTDMEYNFVWEAFNMFEMFIFLQMRQHICQHSISKTKWIQRRGK